MVTAAVRVREHLALVVPAGRERVRQVPVHAPLLAAWVVLAARAHPERPAPVGQVESRTRTPPGPRRRLADKAASAEWALRAMVVTVELGVRPLSTVVLWVPRLVVAAAMAVRHRVAPVAPEALARQSAVAMHSMESQAPHRDRQSWLSPRRTR